MGVSGPCDRNGGVRFDARVSGRSANDPPLTFAEIWVVGVSGPCDRNGGIRFDARVSGRSANDPPLTFAEIWVGCLVPAIAMVGSVLMPESAVGQRMTPR